MEGLEIIEEFIVIGIDVGSTSVKVGAYRYLPNNISQALEVMSEKYPTGAFENLESHGYHQMNFTLVIETIQKCLKRIEYAHRIRAKKLGICGQMHGIVFWNEGAKEDDLNNYYPWKYDSFNGQFNIEHKRFSSYITWKDNRCSQRFIEQLVADNFILAEMERKTSTGIQTQSNTSCGQLSSGFGLTTALWFVRNDKKYLNRFNRCGTPMTVILMMLLNSKDAAMSEQNREQDEVSSNLEDSRNSYAVSDQIAASWGFYNLEQSTWHIDSLRRLDFPVSFDDDGYSSGIANNLSEENLIKLPRILPGGSYLGRSKTSWLLLPKGVQLYVECGDMQCSARVCLTHRSKAAIMNLSTSIQMAILLNKIPDQQFINNYPGLNIVPYLNGQYLLVAASLNGGCVLQRYVEFIHDIVAKIAKPKRLSMDDIWDTLLACNEVPIPSLDIKPTIYGERHDPALTGSISNIRNDNLNVGCIMSSLCYGILKNILTMMPIEILRANEIQQVICVGNVIQKNPFMRSIIESTFKQLNIRVNFLMTADAQEGAAMNTVDKVTATY